MKTTTNLEKSKAAFVALSKSRKQALAKQANDFIEANPGSADASIFWRGLSARLVTILYHTSQRY